MGLMRFTAGNDWLLLGGSQRFTGALPGIFFTYVDPGGPDNAGRLKQQRLPACQARGLTLLKREECGRRNLSSIPFVRMPRF